MGVSCVQVSDVTAGLVEERVSGRRGELSAALLEVTQRYLSQFQLLSEIQGLRSRWVSPSCRPELPSQLWVRFEPDVAPVSSALPSTGVLLSDFCST